MLSSTVTSLTVLLIVVFLFKEGFGVFNQKPIEEAFTAKGLLYLGSKDIQFKCSCSRDRMVMGLLGLLRSSSKEELFEGKDSLEAKCDYCKTFYEITQEELVKGLENI